MSSAKKVNSSSLPLSLASIVVENIKDYAIFSMDIERRVTFWNPGSEAIFGYSAEEILGKSGDLLFTPEDRTKDAAGQEARMALESGKATDERWHLRKDGSRFFASGLLMPMREDGILRGFVKVARDITHRKQNEEELRLAKEEAERANRTKTAFLANMSHEIRTPLSAILGFTDLLLDPDTSDTERAEAIQIIKKNGDLLLKIINNVLDLSKMEAEQFFVERSSFRLRELIEEVMASLRLKAEEKGILLESFYAQLPDTVVGDATKIRQILMNVLSNAVKFTEQGAVHLYVRESFRRGNSISLNFVVKDTGIGMNPEQAQRIFDPFVQADPSLSHRYGGTGLGLPISSRLADLMGGQLLLLESAVGKGSTFEIYLKVELPEKSAAKPRKSQAQAREEKPLEGVRLLLAEDMPDNLFLMSKRLRSLGAIVAPAANGREAVEQALSSPPDAILMDLQMPFMDGYQATQALRARAYEGLIIALTAHALNEEREKALRQGFDEYLTKPIDREVLVGTLRRLLKPDP